MKRILIFLFAFLIAIAGWADSYIVTAETLELYSEPSTTSGSVLTLSHGAIVNTDQMFEPSQNVWVKVNHDILMGYVQSQHLELAESLGDVLNGVPTTSRDWRKILAWEGKGFRWLAYVIGVLALFMWFECKLLRDISIDFMYAAPDKSGAKRWRWINASLVFLCSGIILFYVYKMGNNALWFFYPKIIGSWWYIIPNFIIFVYIFIDLLVFNLKTIKDFADFAEVNIKLKLGILTYLIGIICAVAGLVFSMDVTYVYIAICALQVVQMIIILYQFGRKGHLSSGFITCAIYLIGSLSLIILLSFFVTILIGFIIVGLCFLFVYTLERVPGGIFSSKAGLPSSFDASDGSCGNRIIDGNGNNVDLRLLNEDGGLYEGSDGNTYQKIDNTFTKV